MRCREVRACIGESEGSAWPAAAAAHLEECPDCAAYAARLRQVDRLLTDQTRAAVPMPDPAQVRSRLHMAIAGGAGSGRVGFRFRRIRRFHRHVEEETMDANQTGVHPAALFRSRRATGAWATAGLVAAALGLGAMTGGWVSQRRIQATAGYASGQAASVTGGQAISNSTETVVPRATEQVLREISLNRLKQLGLGAYMYADAHGETLPLLDSADHARAALLPYVENNDVLFVNPTDGQAYHPNAWASEKPIQGIEVDRSQVVLFYENPRPDGSRNAVFLDGHAQSVPPDQWEQIRAASHLP